MPARAGTQVLRNSSFYDWQVDMKIRILTPEYNHAYTCLMLQALQQFPADFAASDIQELQQTGGHLFGAFNEKNELIGTVGLRQEQLQNL